MKKEEEFSWRKPLYDNPYLDFGARRMKGKDFFLIFTSTETSYVVSRLRLLE